MLDGTDITRAGHAATIARRRGEGSMITFGLRPEHLAVASDADDQVVRFTVIIDLVEFLGSEQLVHATFAETELVAIVPDSADVKVADALELAIADTRIHLFDPESEARLDAGERDAAPAGRDP